VNLLDKRKTEKGHFIRRLTVSEKKVDKDVVLPSPRNEKGKNCKRRTVNRLIGLVTRGFEGDLNRSSMIFKVLVVGNKGVGLSTLQTKLADVEESVQYETPTLGVFYTVSTFETQNGIIQLDVWTLNEHQIRFITSSCFRQTKAIVLVYDCADPKSLAALKTNWIPEIDKGWRCPNALKILVGNKSDIKSKSVMKKAEFLAAQMNFMHSTVSATLDSSDNLRTAILVKIASDLSAREFVPPDPSLMPMDEITAMKKIEEYEKLLQLKEQEIQRLRKLLQKKITRPTSNIYFAYPKDQLCTLLNCWFINCKYLITKTTWPSIGHCG